MITIKKYLFLFLILILTQLNLQEKSYKGLIQDGRFKYIQIQDFIHFQFKSFERHYPDTELDQDFSHRIYKLPFEHYVPPKVYSVFPWVWTVMNVPFYMLLPYPGLFLISFSFGGISIYYFYKILVNLGVPGKVQKYSILFYILSTPLVIYSSWYYEATFCSFLLYFSIASFTENFRNFEVSKLKYFFSGIITGFHLFLRIEVGFLNGVLISLIAYSYYLLEKKKGLQENQNLRRKYLFGYSLFILGVLILFVIHLWTNKLIYGIYEPLIFYDVIDQGLKHRFLNLLGYLFTYKFSLLIYFPVSFYTLFLLRKGKNFLHSEENLTLKFILIGAWIFMLLLPVVASQQQGMDMTPRYFFPILPLVSVFLFQRYEELDSKKWVYTLTILYSSLFIFIFSLLSIFTTRQVAKSSKAIGPYIGETNLVSFVNINDYVYNYPNKNYYLCDTKDELLEWNQKIIEKTKVRPRIILQKMGKPQKSKSIFHSEDEFELYKVMYDTYREIYSLEKEKIYFEDDRFIIFDLTSPEYNERKNNFSESD